MPVQLNRFYIDSSVDLSYLPGASARNNQLFFAHKQVALGDDPERSKYQSGHFIKELHAESYGQLIYQARKEVCFQELLRLLIQGQPKARLVQNNRRKVYIQSKAIPNSEPFIFNPDISPEVYGTDNFHHGLGELNFYLNNVLLDYDQELRNYIVDTKLRVYRVDFGLTEVFGQNLISIFNYEPLSRQGLFHSLLKNNQHYQLERNRALLKFLLLPHKLIEAFFNYHLEEHGALMAEQIILTQSIYAKAIRVEEAVLNDLFPGFKDYIKSPKARADAYLFEHHLMTFKLKGKLFFDELIGEPIITKRLESCYTILKEQGFPRLTKEEIINASFLQNDSLRCA